MSLFDAINTAERGMQVHRLRSEVAAENIANVMSPGYRMRTVNLAPGKFSSVLDGVTTSRPGSGSNSLSDAHDGAVRVASIGTAPGVGGDDDYRGKALFAITEMMESKSALELNVRSAAMLKSMALSALEIGRGG
jgi:flagellar basal body rod protein FlgC